MPASDQFLDFLKEQLAGLGPVQTRRMFSGAGVYCDGVIFGLVINDALYLKADAASKAEFEAEGMGPFVYDGKDKPVIMSYWRAPERLLDEPDELTVWARKALAVSKASSKPSKPARAAKPAKPKKSGARRVVK